jgi:hypothetical protein
MHVRLIISDVLPSYVVLKLMYFYGVSLSNVERKRQPVSNSESELVGIDELLVLKSRTSRSSAQHDKHSRHTSRNLSRPV